MANTNYPAAEYHQPEINVINVEVSDSFLYASGYGTVEGGGEAEE